jgi:negative regulator of sigma E activity
MATKKRSELTMDEQFSALLDNELEANACARAISRVAEDPALKDAWSRQALLRAALAGEDRCLPDADFADSVMAAIFAEETAPSRDNVVPFTAKRNLRTRLWATGGLALAASIVGVVITLGVMPVERTGQAAMMAAAEPGTGLQKAALQTAASEAASDAEVQRELEEYLLEHQRMAGRHGIAVPRGYMRMATPGFTQVSYSGE